MSTRAMPNCLARVLKRSTRHITQSGLAKSEPLNEGNIPVKVEPAVKAKDGSRIQLHQTSIVGHLIITSTVRHDLRFKGQ